MLIVASFPTEDDPRAFLKPLSKRKDTVPLHLMLPGRLLHERDRLRCGFALE